MSVPTKVWLWLCAVIITTGAAVWYHGYHTADAAWTQRDTDRKLDDATTANQAWAERFTLQAQLATRDQQLAEAQQAASEARTETIIKREVIYRDKIKTVAVRDCVADSGLLDLYDATLGLSDTTE